MAGKHRLYEETIAASVYATDRGTFLAGGGHVVGRVFRRIEVGDFWPLESPLADWEIELIEAVSAARRERGIA